MALAIPLCTAFEQQVGDVDVMLFLVSSQYENVTVFSSPSFYAGDVLVIMGGVGAYDAVLPDVTVTSPYDGQVFSVGTSEVVVYVNTSEQCLCNYTVLSMGSLLMNSSDKIVHNATVAVSIGTSYTVQFYCVDMSYLVNDTVNLTFSVSSPSASVPLTERIVRIYSVSPFDSLGFSPGMMGGVATFWKRMAYYIPAVLFVFLVASYGFYCVLKEKRKISKNVRKHNGELDS